MIVTRHFPTYDKYWFALATLAGLAVAVLPLQVSILIIGAVGLGILFLLEPSLAFVLMLAVAPLKTLIETELGWGFPVDIGQMCFALAMGVWTFGKVLRRDPLYRHGKFKLFPPMFLFLIATLATLPGAYSPGKGINEWIKWLEILILVWVVRDHAQTRWQWFMFGVISAAVAQAFVGIYEFRGGSGAAHLWILDYRYFRAFGTFGQPNPFGAFMGLALPLTLGVTYGYLTQWVAQAWVSYRARKWQISLTTTALVMIFAAASLILLVGLLVSWSRGAWLGFAAAFAVLLWFAPTSRKWGTLLIGAGAIGFAMLWLGGLLPLSITERVLSFQEDFTGFHDVRGVIISDENFAVVERLAHWQAALGMAAQHPWLGVGFGNYEIAYPNFALVNWGIALGHAHNYYLNLLAETGILGLTAYLILWGSVFYQTVRVINVTQGFERSVALGLMGVWVHLSVHSMVDNLYVNNLFLHIGVMLGILAALHRGD